MPAGRHGRRSFGPWRFLSGDARRPQVRAVAFFSDSRAGLQRPGRVPRHPDPPQKEFRMATHDITQDRPSAAAGHGRPAPSGPLRRLATETKAAFKTTEFYAYLAVLAGLLIAGNTIEGKDGGADYFAADKIWLYVTLLTIGYMISRGLAKAGSRDPYWDERGDRDATH
jgi:hypothetical protein